MSRIDELIRELCPEGVATISLGDAVEIQGGFAFPASGFNTQGDGLRVIRIGDVNSDRNQVFWDGAYPSNCLVGSGDLIISLSGDINVATWNSGDALLNQRVAKLVPFELVASSRYLYHFLKLELGTLSAGTSKSVVANLSLGTLKTFPVPLPPLKVQKEIVSILDKFTQLEAELEAELEARRTQYEVTRDRLLDFSGDLSSHPIGELIWELCPEGVPSQRMADLGCLYSGLSGKSKSDFQDGNVTYVSYLDIGNHPSLSGRLMSRVRVGDNERQNSISKGDLLFTGSSEDREGVGLTSEVEYEPSESIYLNSFCFGWRPNLETFSQGFLKHLFRSHEMRHRVMRCSNGVTRINISKKSLLDIEIPVPPLEIQREIVSILDKLEALVNDITYGLPAEIEARRKQYDYYRNKLLTFKVLDAA